jgi:hypothetical protein
LRASLLAKNLKVAKGLSLGNKALNLTNIRNVELPLFFLYIKTKINLRGRNEIDTHFSRHCCRLVYSQSLGLAALRS